AVRRGEDAPHQPATAEVPRCHAAPPASVPGSTPPCRGRSRRERSARRRLGEGRYRRRGAGELTERRANEDLPLVVLTGATGAVGTALVGVLRGPYRVVGLDRAREGAACEIIEADLGSADSVRLAIEELARRHGARVASVIHLAAYFDFTGEQ